MCPVSHIYCMWKTGDRQDFAAKLASSIDFRIVKSMPVVMHYKLIRRGTWRSSVVTKRVDQAADSVHHRLYVPHILTWALYTHWQEFQIMTSALAPSLVTHVVRLPVTVWLEPAAER